MTQSYVIGDVGRGQTVSLDAVVSGSNAQPGSEVCFRITAVLADQEVGHADQCVTAAADGSFNAVVHVGEVVAGNASVAGGFNEQALAHQPDGSITPVGPVGLYTAHPTEGFSIGRTPVTALTFTVSRSKPAWPCWAGFVASRPMRGEQHHLDMIITLNVYSCT